MDARVRYTCADLRSGCCCCDWPRCSRRVWLPALLQERACAHVGMLGMLLPLACLRLYTWARQAWC